MNEAQRRNTYTLDPACQSDQERLLTFAHLHADFVRDAGARTGLRRGGRAIDIGCGPLGGLHVLADLVGPDGVVVGLDRSAATLAQTRRHLDDLGLARVVLVESDIDATTAETVAPHGPFDLAFCRCFLIHQADPAAALRRMAGLVRPGGAIVAHELLDEPRFPLFDPPVPATERFFELLAAVMRSKGGSPDAGRRFDAICAAANLELVSQRGFFFPLPAALELSFPCAGLASIRRSILDAGLSTEAELDALSRALEAAKAIQYRSCFSSLFVELIARVNG